MHVCTRTFKHHISRIHGTTKRNITVIQSDSSASVADIHQFHQIFQESQQWTSKGFEHWNTNIASNQNHTRIKLYKTANFPVPVNNTLVLCEAHHDIPWTHFSTGSHFDALRDASADMVASANARGGSLSQCASAFLSSQSHPNILSEHSNGLSTDLSGNVRNPLYFDKPILNYVIDEVN